MDKGYSTDKTETSSATGGDGLNETTAAPTPVQQEAVETPKVEAPTTEKPGKTSSSRKDLEIKALRSKAGTSRYDNFKPASTQIVKVDLTLDASGFAASLTAAEVLKAALETRTWKDANARTAGDTNRYGIPTLNGTGDNVAVNAVFEWRDLNGVPATVGGVHAPDGTYTVTLTSPDDTYKQPYVFDFEIKNGNFSNTTSNGFEVTADTPEGYQSLINLEIVNETPTDVELVRAHDIFNLLNKVVRTNPSTFSFTDYECYRISSMKLDIQDVSNYLKTNTAVLAYYVSDPARLREFPARAGTKMIDFEPHLACVKLFKGGSNLSWQVPVSTNKFFVKEAGEIRLHSPGYIALVPLNLQGHDYSFAVTLTAVVQLYCQTKITQDALTGFWEYIPLDIPESNTVYQDNIHALPYIEVTADTQGKTQGRLAPRNMPTYRFDVNGLSIAATPTSVKIVALNVVRLYFSTLRELNEDYSVGMEIQLTDIIRDNQNWYLTGN